MQYFSSRAFRPTRGIVIQKFVCASVRASVRMMSQTCNRHNLRTMIGMDLLFFLMGWYKQGVVQWQTKLGLRMGKALICNSFLHYLLCNICILGNIWTWKGNENQTNIIFTYLDTFPRNLNFGVKLLEITKCLKNISLRDFGRSEYCDHQRRRCRCCCRCRWRHTFVPRQN